jgi:hypothetical protein
MPTFNIAAGRYSYARYPQPPRQQITLVLLSTEGQYGALVVSAAGFDAFLKGGVAIPGTPPPPPPPPSYSAALATGDTVPLRPAPLIAQFPPNPPQGVIARIGPCFSYSESLAVWPPVSGVWYLVVGNFGNKAISVQYDVWQ